MALFRKEFRIILPITVEEYHAAQLYAVAEASKNETGGGEGIEVLQNEPYKKDGETGQYTYKLYHLQSRVPRFVQMLAPEGSFEFAEEAWNAYPDIKTVISNNYMKEHFTICLQSKHLADFGESENVHNLSKEDWKNTEVIKIDIVNDFISRNDYKEEFDPKLFHSTKANRGPLGPNWIDQLKAEKESSALLGKPAPAYMCAYKLVSCRFKWFGLQTKVESMIQNQERRLFTLFHRQVVCWMDQWFGLSLEQIRELEDKTKKELDELRRSGSVKGMKCNE